MISRSTSTGEPPAQLVVTVMIGRRTSGVSWIGMMLSASRPNMSVIATAASTAMGRPMAVRMISTYDAPSKRTDWPGRSRSLPRTTT